VRPVLLLPLVFLGGCERGCLTTWLTEHGVGEPAPSSKHAVTFNGVDCPDGLARCIGGVVEVSRVSHYALPCSGPAEACMCPWDSVGACPAGCAADGVEAVVPRERALAQLCASDPAHPVARPVLPNASPPGACDDGVTGYRCLASIVVACTASDAGVRPRAVAACVHACAPGGDAIDEDDATDEGASRILCAVAGP